MREMKYSGVEWVGKIPKHWTVIRSKYRFENHKTIVGNKSELYERLALTMNGVIKRSKDDNNGLQPEKFETYQILKKGELVFKLIDLKNISTSRVGLSGYTGIVSPAYIIISCGKDMLPEYAEYWFLSMWYQHIFNQLGDDGVRSSLNANDLLNLPILQPSLSEQQTIADYLDCKCAEIDSLIAGIEEQIETLEQYKRSVITEAVTKGLNPDVEMKNSGIEWCPIIPKHWIPTNPKALFSLRNQRATKGERQLTASQKHGIVYQDDFMEMENQKVVTVEKDFSILKHVEPNDFVISMRSFQGGLEYSEVSGCISSAYVMLIPNTDLVFPPFYRWFFKSSKYINAIQSTTNLVRDGQAMRYSNFVMVPLFIIPIDEQKKIANYLDDKIGKVDAVLADKRAQHDTLVEYKKSLIYEYVTGKKEVPVQ